MEGKKKVFFLPKHIHKVPYDAVERRRVGQIKSFFKFVF